MKRVLAGAVALGIAVALGYASLGAAAPEDNGGVVSGAQNIGGFDSINTSRIQFNFQTGNFTLPERFTARSKGTDITADQATGNSKQKVMHAVGHVVVHQTKTEQLSGHGSKANEVAQRPSTLTCDKLDVDGVRKLYTATGNMHFIQEGGREATADLAVLDDQTHQLHMQGHVQVRNGEQTISADTLDYNTESGQIEANGDVNVAAPAQTPEPAPVKKPKKLL